MPNIDEAIEALLAYQQADMEGVMVLTSRQAIHEVADELRRMRGVAQSSGMRDALISVTASLAAAVSLLERTPKAKSAAPSNTMFNMMLSDYRKALETGRSALAISSTQSESTK